MNDAIVPHALIFQTARPSARGTRIVPKGPSQIKEIRLQFLFFATEPVADPGGRVIPGDGRREFDPPAQRGQNPGAELA